MRALVGIDGDVAASCAFDPLKEEERVAACSWSCSFCQYRVVVRGGHAVSVKPCANDLGTTCLRGISRVQTLRSRERIRYPLKRAGKRGEGLWERIGWDEAVDLIVSAWKKAASEFGPRANSWYVCSGTQGQTNGNLGLIRRFFNAMEVTLWDFCFDFATGYGFMMAGMSWDEFNEPTDWVNARAIVLWGANPCVSNMPMWQYIQDAQREGVCLVDVDPLYSVTASKADVWVNPYPGTDAALCLGICRILVEEGSIDRAFLRDHTCAPFLVNPVTGNYLRAGDLSPEQAMAAGAKESHDLLVLDEEDGCLRALNVAKQPSLTASGHVDALGDVHTTFDILCDRLRLWTPDRVESVTGVGEGSLRRLANLCAGGNAVHYMNMGAAAYGNGVHSVRAVMLVAALTGNMGKPGASVGGFYHIWGNYFGQLAENDEGRTYRWVPILCGCDVMRTGMYLGEPYPVKTLFISDGNLLGSGVNSNRMREEFLLNMDFVAVSDVYYTEDAHWADVVLPACDPLEYEDFMGYAADHVLRLSEKAVEPAYEAKPDGEVAKLFARAMGLEELVCMDSETCFQRVFDTDWSREVGSLRGIDMNTLRDRKQVRYVDEDPYIAYRDLSFATDSGRMEFYLDQVVPRLDTGVGFDLDAVRLPDYVEPFEVGRDNPLAQRFPYAFVSWRNRARVHSTGVADSWAKETVDEPLIWMNPQDAAREGLCDGQLAEAYNDRGHVVARLVLSQAMMPGVVCYPKGFQRCECVAGSFNELITDAFDPISVNSNFMDNRVALRAWKGV